ncbi:MAG TPA: hypothetical protein VNY30_12120 [Bryobacteraceae bacterium]|jgi:hypothetical protein|nr:hypothetical protein [Bryobacteraceae bacterium]
MRLPVYILLPFAAICSVVALLLWLVFLRPVERKTAPGIITHKILKPAGQYVQYPVGMRAAFFAPSRIPIAECYVFTIQVDDIAADVAVALNTLAAEEYQVGQTVKIQYEERSLPGIWRRVYVTQMEH